MFDNSSDQQSIRINLNLGRIKLNIDRGVVQMTHNDFAFFDDDSLRFPNKSKN